MAGIRASTVLALGCIASALTGCSFQGLNSLPLPGAVGRGGGSVTYHLDIANVGSLEANSPVMVADVVVGSVAKITFVDWHADVEVSLRPDAVVPANAVATVGQTSLLGSMHVALNPPLGQSPTGRLSPGAVIPLNSSATYPSTEQTLSSLAAVVNGGGLGQIGDIVHNATLALAGRESDVRQLLSRLNDLVSVLDTQRDSINATISALDRLADTFATQRDVLDRTLDKLPAALDVLIREQPRFITALDKLRTLSVTATHVVQTTQDDLVTNLRNLEPTLRALADVGPYLDTGLAFATVYPFGQNLIDRGLKGDYMNLFAVLDLTVPRLKRSLFIGTRWGDINAIPVPAPGEPYYHRYSYDPIGDPVAGPPPAAALAPPADSPPMLVVTDPVLPVTPPLAGPQGVQAPAPGGSDAIFAGPYPGPPVQKSR